MKTSYAGFKENVITVEADSSLTKAGSLVKINADGKAAACAAGEAFCGVCLNLRNGFAAVMLEGHVTMPLDGECEAGYQKLSAADGQSVKSDSKAGREYLVLASAAGEIGFIL